MVREALTAMSAFVALLATLACLGCERETTPPLIQVLGVSPHEVEEGDRLVIEGVGFPEGKVAHVAFRGDLHRPGVPAVQGVEVDVDAVASNGTVLEVPVTPAFAQLFAGAGDHAAHTTFSGDVTVAFAARATAAPPVAGTLHDAWIDVRPEARHRATADGEAGEGERTLAFLGIKPQPEALPAGGVLIAAVDPGSRAEAARLLPGDVITEMAGVRVLSMRDLVASPGDRVAWLKIRRGGSPREEVATVSLLGWKPPAAAALLVPVVLISVAALFFVFFCAPTPRFVVWAERAIAARLDGGRTARGVLREGLRGLPHPLLMAGASAVFGCLPFAHYFGAFDLDAGILVIAALTALVGLALVTGGSRPGRPYSFVAALRAAGRCLSLGVPVLVAVAGVVILAGSVHLEDLVRAQQGLPWGWALFKTPLALLMFASAAIAAFAGGHTATSSLPLGLPRAVASRSPLFSSPRAEPSLRVLFFGMWAYRAVVSILGVALFLGGWMIPGLAPEQMEAHLGWTAIGALVFVGKVWLVLLALAAADRLLPRVGADQVTSLCWMWLSPLSIAGLLLTALWAAERPGPSVETLVGAVTLGLTCAVVLHVATRVRYFRRVQAGELDPFI
jgi:NADH-quinone oxidoreductase subunit H